MTSSSCLDVARPTGQDEVAQPVDLPWWRPPEAVDLNGAAELLLHDVKADEAVLSIVCASDRASTSLFFCPASTTAMGGTSRHI